MSVKEMRDAIRQVYDTDTWRYKVSKMKEGQVIAVYFSFKKRGLVV